MRKHRFSIVTAALIFLITCVDSYNILFWSLFGAQSHRNVLDPVAEELARRGHQIVMFTCINDTRQRENFREIFNEEAHRIMFRDGMSFFNKENIRAKMIETLTTITNATFTHPFIEDLLRNPKDPKTNLPKFDVIIMDATCNEQALPIANHLQIPVVLFSTTMMFYHHTWLMNIPHPLSYVPVGIAAYPKHMSFIQRTLNFLSVPFYLYDFPVYGMYSESDLIVKQYLPNSPPILDLINRVSFAIANTHVTIGPSVPTMSYYKQLGGLHCKPAKPLPKDLEDYMQSSGTDGVIYFSLGSHTSGLHMPSQLTDNLLKVFSQIPQKVLWKNEAAIPRASENVKFISWAPQGDLLAHPKLKLFITHGGMLSYQESAYHGCPILGFPLIDEQWSNMGNAVDLGFGEMLDYETFTAEELHDKITKMIEDKRDKNKYRTFVWTFVDCSLFSMNPHNVLQRLSYRDNAQKVSALFRDRPEPPLQTAAYWIEYVSRHKGAPHLKSAAENLNFFQYYLLDVISFLVLVLGLVMVMLVCIFKRILRRVTHKTGSVNKLKKH